MRVVALDAVANRGTMHLSFAVGRAFVGMAGQAERYWRRGDELYPSDIFVDPDLVAAQTAGCHRGVNRFSFGFLAMTFQAFGCIRVFI